MSFPFLAEAILLAAQELRKTFRYSGKEYGTADCLGWTQSWGPDFACAWWQLRSNAPSNAPQKSLGQNLHVCWAAVDPVVAVQHLRQCSRGPSSFVFGSKTKLLLFHVRQSLLTGFPIFHQRAKG